MTDIQSARSVSRTSCSEEVLSSAVSFHDRQLTVLFNAIFGCRICWSINCPAFAGTKKGIFLSQKVIS